MNSPFALVITAPTIGLGNVFSSIGFGIAWSGIRWVAVGSEVDTIAYSSDGITWNGIGNTIFSTNGSDVAWNGSIWVAVGSGTNSIAWSSDGITWIGLGTSIFTDGYSVAWNGIRWVATGDNSINSIAYSSDGITWTGIGTSIFQYGNGVAGNPKVGATIVDSVITLNSNILPNTNRLDIVAANYYNKGYSNFSIDFISNSS